VGLAVWPSLVDSVLDGFLGLPTDSDVCRTLAAARQFLGFEIALQVSLLAWHPRQGLARETTKGPLLFANPHIPKIISV
jgi:hypothetical protein